MAEVYFGKMIIGNILNVASTEKVQMNEHLHLPELHESNIKYVHYQDCQQLIIWLPASGKEYEHVRIVNQKNKQVGFEEEVSDILQGSLQIIIDSLPFPPGEYELVIKHKSGIKHIVELEKLPEGVDSIEEISPKHVTDTDGASIIYRDGVGNILPDEDIRLRERIIAEMQHKLMRKLSYRGNARAGYVIYTDGDIKLEFESEMGGGDCMFIVSIPAENLWEAETGIPIDRRDEIIRFVATGTQRDQASNCRFEIRDHEIVYYRN
jgi:hypothetical protein